MLQASDQAGGERVRNKPVVMASVVVAALTIPWQPLQQVDLPARPLFGLDDQLLCDHAP